MPINHLKLYFLFAIIVSFGYLSGFGIQSIVFAQSLEQIQQQKTQKQQELIKINNEINSISNSSASINSKLTSLKAEKAKLEKLTSEMNNDVVLLQKQAEQQESELVELANKYSLQTALFYAENQNGALFSIFKSSNISQVLDRLLFHYLQDNLLKGQEEYINLKKEGLFKKQAQITEEQKTIQSSLSGVNQTIATLEDEQRKLATSYSKSYSQRTSLVSDISKLSRAAQTILNKKATGAKPPGGIGAGAGGGGSTTAPSTVNTTGVISIIVNGILVQKTSNIVKLTSTGNNITLKGAQTGSFAGNLEFDKKSGVYVINSLPIDQYLWGLAEMPSSWPTEALKVQAIAGRSYAVYRIAQGGYGGKFDIYDSVKDQEYVGLGKINSSYGNQWKTAVDSTSNKILKYGGSLVQAFYSAEAGGHTISSAESSSFGGTRSYLIAKSDRYLDNGVWKPYGNSNCTYWIIQGTKPSNWVCAQTRQSKGINTLALMEDYINGAIYYDKYKNVKATSEQSAATLAAALGSGSIKSRVGNISSIEHIYDVGGSTITEGTKLTKYVKVVGDKGEYTLSGLSFKTSYNVRAPYDNAVWSGLYDIKKIDGNNWELWTRGYGHRVGMSQYGAYGRANAGQSAELILSHYYNGANVVEYNVGRNIRVALEKYGSRVMKISSSSEISIFDGSTLLKKVSPNTEIRVEYN